MELGPIELVMLLLVVATGLAYVARRIGIAYPILLVLGGLALGALGYALAPDLLSEVHLEPDLVFLLFLPPILFGSGFNTPIRDLKANAPADRPARHRARAVHDGRGRPRAWARSIPDAAAAPRRSRSAPSWRRRTRWPRRPSCAGSASRRGS